MINIVIRNLGNRLKEPLPGEQAQLHMGSGVRMKELRFMPENEHSKKSGVMILLYPKNNTFYSALILRPKYSGTHSGQVALPGGKYEKCDKDLVATALRETFEEIGIESSAITVLGQLTKLFIPPSNFIVYPAVGFTQVEPVFIPDKNEVKEIIEYPVSALLQEDIVKEKLFVINKDVSFIAPYFDINGHVVWGATAMILSEFKEILKSIWVSKEPFQF